jgi:hypothetical protein
MSPLVSGIDVFAGAGGLTLGLKAAGIITAGTVEIDPHRVATFARHTPSPDSLTADICRINLSTYRGKGEFVYGGPLCQLFSSGGLHAGPSDERDMVPWFIKAARDIHPVAFLPENVLALVTGDRAASLATLDLKLSRFCPDVSRNQAETRETKSKDRARKYLIFLWLLCSWCMVFTNSAGLKILWRVTAIRVQVPSPARKTKHLAREMASGTENFKGRRLGNKRRGISSSEACNRGLLSGKHSDLQPFLLRSLGWGVGYVFLMCSDE